MRGIRSDVNFTKIRSIFLKVKERAKIGLIGVAIPVTLQLYKLQGEATLKGK